jgi:glyoxylase-like metal-dependent hydrolase (beta-lactamase superfamily II)
MRRVRELQRGVWHWQARHPEWTPKDAGPKGWGPEVSSYAIDDGKRLLLIDPLSPPSLVDELASGREPVVLLTCPWHRRDAQGVVERLGASVYVPPPDDGDPDPVRGTVFEAGERLPVAVEAFPGMEANDLVLWVESRRALVTGDTLVDRGNGLEFPADWATKGPSPEEILASLRPLLELPVELVLPTHGAPTDRAALERALA